MITFEILVIEEYRVERIAISEYTGDNKRRKASD